MRTPHQIRDSFDPVAELPRGALVELQSIGDELKRLIREFEGHGISVNPSSRIHRYANALCSVDRSVTSDRIDELLDQAYAEVCEFKTISRALSKPGGWDCARPFIREIVSGGIRPSEDQSHNKARSTQFELLVWAWTIIAGFHCRFSEPDLVVTAPSGRQISIAAKRARSQNKIAKLIREGSRQVSSRKEDGIVAIDLSYVESLSKPVWIRQAQHCQILAKTMLDGFVSEHQDEICDAISGRNLIGVLFHYRSTLRSLLPPTRITSRRWLLLQTRSEPIDADALDLIEKFGELGQGAISEKGTVPN